MPVRTSLLSVVAGFFLVAGGAAAGEPYRDPNVRFTLEVPDGWQAMPAEELDRLHAATEGLASDRPPKYHAGFRRRGAEPFVPPYVLVRVARGQAFGKTWDEVKRSLDKMAAGLPRDVGKPVLSKDRDRFTFFFKCDGPDGRPVRGTTYGHLGSHATVLLDAHSDGGQRAFVRDAPTFERMSESFRFDDGYAFTAAPDPLADVKSLAGPGPWWVVLPLLALVMVIVVKALRIFLRPDWERD